MTTAPLVPQYHLFDGGTGPHVLVADGSRVYALPPDAQDALATAAASRDPLRAAAALRSLDLDAAVSLDEVPHDPPVRSLSLAVAQSCNLGCTYCYAQQGDFGGPARPMPLDVALRSVRGLVDGARPGDRVTVVFLGGEPLANRPVLRAATEEAAARGADRGVAVGFSLTTNGTMLRADDAEFFERHRFSMTVSLDGVGQAHDRLRPTKRGAPTYDRVLERVVPVLRGARDLQVSARVTVTPRNLALPETLEEFVRLGFHSVGFSPMLSSPTGVDQLGAGDLDVMLEQMVRCAERFEQRLREGRPYPFLNAVNALREIHRGTHRPYPCGAGAGYFGVGADGGIYACHRFVEDGQARMGHVDDGVDRTVQRVWLTSRHVDRQDPCSGCWARYLCGGGCHHEVLARGRPACDYVRGWLDHCLGMYARLADTHGAYLDSLVGAAP